MLATERVGVQLPALRHVPPAVVSVERGVVACELADRFELAGGLLDESQRWRLLNALGTRVDGRWAAPTVADFGGRQGSGKTTCIEARVLAGATEFGERLIIHTAHEFPTANESFLKMAELFTEWDDLARQVSKIRFANGEQSIWMKNRCRILYKARTGGSGRGYRKADLLIYDETQHISAEHVAASGPTRLANPNPQAWYAGSGGFSTSSQAWQLRRLAMKGDPATRLAYSEFTGQRWALDGDGRVQLDNPDPADRDAWALANPGLGRWVSEEAMETLYDEMTPEVFAREIGCVWEPDPGDMVGVALPNWRQLADATSSVLSQGNWAVAVAPDRSYATVGVAGRDRDGRLHVEVWRSEPGTEWVVDAVAAKYRQKRVPIRVHQAGPEASLIGPLREAGVDVVEISTGELARATGQLLDAAASRQLSHLGQPELDKAVAGGILRSTPEGAAIWARRLQHAEISPLVAVTVAAGGVPVASRKPRIH